MMPHVAGVLADRRVLSSHERFTDGQHSHLIARSPCDFCSKRCSIIFVPKRHSILTQLSTVTVAPELLAIAKTPLSVDSLDV